MGKLSEFTIVFNGNRVVFYPGETVTGNVVMGLSSQMEMRGIQLKVSGKSYCHWSESETDPNDSSKQCTVHYSGSEQLFDYKFWVHGNGRQRFFNNYGRFFFPFTFTLPAVLPSSFEGGVGYIRYFVSAEIDKPWKFNHRTKMPFTINEVIDPNRPEYANTMPNGSQVKEVGCLCCASGNLQMKANIDRGAYCPGEHILITSHIDNQTTRDMTALKGKLYKVIEYRATRKTKVVHEKIAEILGPAIPQSEFARWENQPLQIPATNPSILNSSIICVHYEMKIEVDVPWGFDPKITMPVVMGSIPFRGGNQPPPYSPGAPAAYPPPQPGMYPPQQLGFENPNFSAGMPPPAAYTGPPPPANMISYQSIAPPSYAAAVGAQQTNIKGEDDGYTFGTLNYTPVYTFVQPSAPPMHPPTHDVIHTQPGGFNQPAGGYASATNAPLINKPVKEKNHPSVDFS